MNIIFQIDGGIGKSVAATAVCKAIKRHYPQHKLLVITGYPEVFLCNPHVDKVYSFGNLNYFYKDNIEGQEVMTMLHNPYFDTEFINMRGHLIEVWCKMLGIAYNGEQPELYITAAEHAQYGRNFLSQKPLMLLQTNGGAAGQGAGYSWARDLPAGIAQTVVNTFAPHYHVVHIKRNDQPGLQNTTPLQADFRAIAVLMTMSHKRLFIDSFCQHTAAAMGMPSVVCWVGNSPAQFGYAIHTNIVAKPPVTAPELRQAVFSRYNIAGTPTECPYRHDGELFDADAIVQAVLQQPVPQQLPAHPLQPVAEGREEMVQPAVLN